MIPRMKHLEVIRGKLCQWSAFYEAYTHEANNETYVSKKKICVT